METDQLITDTLLKMKSDLLEFMINPTKSSYDQLINKYNTLFLGKKLNKVLSLEVAYYLDIPNPIFNKHIETIAANLDMNLDELVAVENIDNQSPDAYYIELV